MPTSDILFQRARTILEARAAAPAAHGDTLVGLSGADGVVQVRVALHSWEQLVQSSAELVELGFAARTRTAQERAECFAAVFQADPALSVISRPSKLE